MPLPPKRCRVDGCTRVQPCQVHPKGWASSKSPSLPGNWKSIKKDFRRSSREACYLCGTVDINGQLDHKIPRAEGGSDSRDNLGWICRSCHGVKTAQERKRGRKRRKRHD